ncbi:hypothetical protein PHYSODRAFT_473133 [Phytophthora sojae]|uniref:Uncharacterized protein n=1 Tax=Phytophthora sojae (strain P6497) TaxID=1094619 RepID=G4YPS4_PHYSP|nr:hypothetical protein PHYSODRAFT_473133 [Phytophthora sojae]EGZ28671.1 hypothetical protein PHYSODRAFT_473133 [Phytophthora sojae]|eukprot:XP_009515946.1 hypothetical protein PHYSODRAFT_473133 [Phytophthora sojae]
MWVSPFIAPTFRLVAVDLCWYLIRRYCQPPPSPESVVIRCSLSGLAAFTDFLNPRHPYQRVRRQLPAQAFFFDTVGFDPSSKISQRADMEGKLRSYWAQRRGYGKPTEIALGISEWERYHWIPSFAVRRCFARLRRHIETYKAYSAKRKAYLLAKLYQIVAAWMKYDRERGARADNMRVKLIKNLWCGALSRDEPDVNPEVIFEPSVLGYAFESLAWNPKGSDWISEIAALETREPWRIGWIDVPEQHPYNTTIVPCNPGVELFVPVGFSRESVGRRITPSSLLRASEISSGSDADFQGPASPEVAPESSPAVPDLPTGPLQAVQTTVQDDPDLLGLLASAAADGTVEI